MFVLYNLSENSMFYKAVLEVFQAEEILSFLPQKNQSTAYFKTTFHPPSAINFCFERRIVTEKYETFATDTNICKKQSIYFGLFSERILAVISPI